MSDSRRLDRLRAAAGRWRSVGAIASNVLLTEVGGRIGLLGVDGQGVHDFLRTTPRVFPSLCDVLVGGGVSRAAVAAAPSPFDTVLHLRRLRRRAYPLAFLLALVASAAAAPLFAQRVESRVPTLVDSSRHRERFVHVDGATLEVLDWGGRGPLMLFLPGFGDNAHVFDDLAPAFRERYHVAALTPRGFPPSSAPDSGYSIAQLARDVRAVVDSLGARVVILVGHSISGAVITQFGTAYPDRIAAAIYLDAAFDFGPAFRRSHRPGRPVPSDTTSAPFRAWRARYSDSLLSKGVRDASRVEDSMWALASADVARRQRLVGPLADEARSREHQPWLVLAPVLSVCAVGSVDRGIGWLTPDSTRWAEAAAFAARAIQEKRDDCQRLTARSPRARAIELDSGHYVFMDARDATVRAMWSFLGTTTRTRR